MSSMNDLTFVTNLADSSGDYKVLCGWNEWVIRQLVERSQEPAMKQWVPRDYSERFSSVEAAAVWGNRDEHVVYSLVADHQLAGIVWFTKYDQPKVEDAEYTFAIRLYDRARGRGIAVPFAEAAIDDLGRRGYTGKIWLETDTSNEAALRLYGNLGFKEKERRDDRIIMIRPAD